VLCRPVRSVQTVIGAFATGGANLAITLLVLFAGLTVAGYLFGLDVRDRTRGGGSQIPDDRRPSPGS
jgi:hypothetical protein